MRVYANTSFLVLIGMLVAAMWILAPPAAPVAHTQEAGTETIYSKALDDHECDDSEWHFVITQIESEDLAPDFITVKWENGDTEQVDLWKFTGGTAHYVTTSNLDSEVEEATAEIYEGWSGEFNLSHGPCDVPTPTSTPTETPTNTPTSTPTEEEEETPTPTATETPTSTETPTPTATEEEEEEETPTPTATATPTQEETSTPTPTSTPEDEDDEDDEDEDDEDEEEQEEATSTPTSTPTTAPAEGEVEGVQVQPSPTEAPVVAGVLPQAPPPAPTVAPAPEVAGAAPAPVPAPAPVRLPSAGEGEDFAGTSAAIWMMIGLMMLGAGYSLRRRMEPVFAQVAQEGRGQARTVSRGAGAAVLVMVVGLLLAATRYSERRDRR